MSDQSAEPTKISRWPDDVLARDKLADFLTKSLGQQSAHLATINPYGLTVALDAGWGTGKSFFIRHWADDLASAGHPVVMFDAWQHDIGDEAAVALMSAIHEELHKWSKKLPKRKQASNAIEKSISSAIRGLRRAIVPTSKVIATGLIKKTTGIAVNEIIDALDDSNADGTNQELKSSTIELIDSSLDTFFKKSLESHRARRQAISDFKESIADVIDQLSDEAGAILPIFVFIDEVDRCRPLYAIQLLEEIKHIFGIANICFVISTNIAQLKESVCGLYGAGFDGHGYLKRFFDQTYTLPDPSNSSYADLLLKETGAFTNRKLELGLPQRSGKYSGAQARDAIGLIFDAFKLDLRSQKQVFSIANSAAAAVDENRSIFILWLFFLSALQHQRPDLFRKIMELPVDQRAFSSICEQALYSDLAIPYNEPRDPLDRSVNTHSAKLSDVLWKYLDWSRGNLINLRDNTPNIYSYPNGNLNAVLEEAPHQYIPSRRYPPSISHYVDLVKYAGMLIKDEPADSSQ